MQHISTVKIKVYEIISYTSYEIFMKNVINIEMYSRIELPLTYIYLQESVKSMNYIYMPAKAVSIHNKVNTVQTVYFISN